MGYINIENWLWHEETPYFKRGTYTKKMNVVYFFTVYLTIFILVESNSTADLLKMVLRSSSVSYDNTLSLKILILCSI